MRQYIVLLLYPWLRGSLLHLFFQYIVLTLISLSLLCIFQCMLKPAFSLCMHGQLFFSKNIYVCTHVFMHSPRGDARIWGVGQQGDPEFGLQSVPQPYCQCLVFLFNSRTKNYHRADNTYNLWVT